jgi:hypothetical protein
MKKVFLTMVMFYVTIIPSFAENIRFDNNNFINIDIPINWNVSQDRGTQLPEMGKTFDLSLTPPSNEKALLIITIGKTVTGKPLTQKQLDALTKAITTNYLKGSLEKKVTYIELPVRNGNGKYSTFTDASLVNKKLDEDDFLYAVPFFVNYNNGCFVYATGLTDDISSVSFQNIVKSISSIEPSLAPVVQTPPVQIKTNKQETIIGNAVNKIKLLIPFGNLKKINERRGGGQNNPAYFYFEDTKTKILISGWFFPIQKFEYNETVDFWAWEYRNVEVLNPEFREIENWEAFIYDLPLSKEFQDVCSAHLRANFLQDDTWIDLHLSITTNKSSEILHGELIEYLKTMQILK